MAARVVFVVVATLVTYWLVWRLGHHRPRRRVPSHTPGYDQLHRSSYWRDELRPWVYYERARGRCEDCHRSASIHDLQLHCLHYRFLDEGTWPTVDDVMMLCPSCHRFADRARRRSRAA